MSFLVSVLFGGILFFPDWMSWYYSVFIVTDRRFIQITQKGFFHRSVVDMGLNQIQMVNYEISGLQETLLGFGTIMMQTFVGDLVIHYLHHPQKIQKHMLEILREEGVLQDISRRHKLSKKSMNKQPHELKYGTLEPRSQCNSTCTQTL